MNVYCWYSNRLLIGNAHPSNWVELNIYCPYPAIFIHSHFKWFNILRVWQHPKRWRKLDKSHLFCMFFRFQHPSVGDYNPVYDMFNHLIHQLYLLMIHIKWIINHQPYIYLWSVYISFHLIPCFFFAPGELFNEQLSRSLLGSTPRWCFNGTFRYEWWPLVWKDGDLTSLDAMGSSSFPPKSLSDFWEAQNRVFSQKNGLKKIPRLAQMSLILTKITMIVLLFVGEVTLCLLILGYTPLNGVSEKGVYPQMTILRGIMIFNQWIR